MRRVIAAAITAVLLLFALLTVGCGSAHVAEASGRFAFEHNGSTEEAYGVDAWTMTDTETGRQWVVLRATEGGVAIEPLYQYVRVEPSNDWGE